MAGYLFAYFRGNPSSQEHLFYALSSDGLNYTPLNGGSPVINFSSIAVTGNVRDPFITRAEDGSWLMVCTDMRSDDGWSSNRGIVMSKSNDLVHWTHATVNFPTKYAGTTYANVTRVWAPEVIYDRQAKRYMVYFSILTNDGVFSYDKVVYCYANEDFTDLDGEPTHLYDRGSATIDMTIVYNEADSKYHAYYKNEGTGGICHISAKTLTVAAGAPTGSQWSTPSGNVQQTTQGVEGPCLFKRLSDGKWILGYDCYAASPAFFQLCEVSDDFTSYSWWGDCANHGAFTPRHGSIIPLTAEEMNALDLALGGADDIAALRAELNEEIARAVALGTDVAEARAVYNQTSASRLQLQEALNSLKVKEYEQVTASYPHDASVLLPTPTNANIASNSSQHWDGTNTSTYYEQPGASWGASSWTSSMTYTAALPRGEYVFRVACRTADSVTGTITADGITVAMPSNGDTGYGINTSGATSFSTADTYANGNKGRGWEWRYVPVSVTTDTRTVTFKISATTSTLHQWFSVTSIGLLSKDVVVTELKEKNETQTAGSVNSTVNITTAIDYKVTSTTPFTSRGSVNIAHDDAVLILANVKPSVVISSWLKYVKINGEPAVNGVNCQVKMYGSGAIILPYGDSLQPLTCFTEPGFAGNSCKDYSLGSDGGYMKTLNKSQLLNSIRSFKLRRGYMVTFATGTSGWGYSRCFIADDQDLELATLPAVLDGKISSYRIFKWNDAQKKGMAAGTDATMGDAINASWAYTWGVGTDMYPDIECLPHKIHKNWPGVAECGSANYSAHMKTDNEPANPSDDVPGTVDEILNYWQDAMRTGMRLLSPSSHDGGYAWQEEFMNAIDARGWRCDVLDMHSYWAEGTFSSLQTYYNKFHRPIWISEMLWGASWNNNGIFSAVSDRNSNSDSNQTTNYNTGKRILDQLNGYDYVERYAWWNEEAVCSKIYYNGALTKLGQYYASMESGIGFSHNYEFVPVVVISNPYSLQGLATSDGISLTWSDSNGDMMDAIQVQYQRIGDNTWNVLATIERQDKTGNGDQNYTFEGTLANADKYAYRVVDLYEGTEYPSATLSFYVEEVDNLSSLPANLGDYYFQFYSKEASEDLCWGVGYGTNTTDVYYHKPADVGTDLSQLWILEVNSNGGYSLRNLATPGFLMCSPNSWNFLTNNSDYTSEAPKTAFEPIYYSAGDYWLLKNLAHNTYVGLWDQDKSFAEGERLAGNRTNTTTVNDSGDRLGIRAIPRSAVNEVISADNTGSWTVGQSYYLYNVDAGRFLVNGNEWGTQASLDNSGLKWTVEKPSTLYRLKNATTSDRYLYATNKPAMWVDGASNTDCNLQLQYDSATGFTTISIDPSSATYGTAAFGAPVYIGWNGDPSNNVLLPSLSETSHCSPAVKWLFLDDLSYAMYKDVVNNALSARQSMWPYVKSAKASGLGAEQIAVYENPASTSVEIYESLDQLRQLLLQSKGSQEQPVDLTFLMATPDCSSSSFAGWNTVGDWGSNTTFYSNGDALLSSRFTETWVASGSSLSNRRLSQTLTNLPAGQYQLCLDIVATQQGNASLKVGGVWLFLGDQRVACSSANGKPETFATEFFDVPANGEVTLGLEIDGTNANWVAFDNFRLLHVGSQGRDVNRDGQVTIADVTALVEIILGKDSTLPYKYDHVAADVNEDGQVTIADVTALVNLIMEQ